MVKMRLLAVAVGWLAVLLTGCGGSQQRSAEAEPAPLAASPASPVVLEDRALDGWRYQRLDLGQDRRRIRLWRGSRELLGPEHAQIDTPFGPLRWVGDNAAEPVVGWAPPLAPEPSADSGEGLVLAVTTVEMAERTRPDPSRARVYEQANGWIYAVEVAAGDILVGRLWHGADEIGGDPGERVRSPWGVLVYHSGSAVGWYPPGAAPSAQASSE